MQNELIFQIEKKSIIFFYNFKNTDAMEEKVLNKNQISTKNFKKKIQKMRTYLIKYSKNSNNDNFRYFDKHIFLTWHLKDQSNQKSNHLIYIYTVAIIICISIFKQNILNLRNNFLFCTNFHSQDIYSITWTSMVSKINYIQWICSFCNCLKIFS
jgi:hypothetical protein